MTSKRDTMAKDLKKAITAENNKISEQVANQTNNITALTSSIDSLKRKSKILIVFLWPSDLSN